MWTTITAARAARWLIGLCLCVAGVNATSLAQSPPSKSRITMLSNLPLRAAPSSSSQAVARLDIGTLVQELERSANQERHGGATDYWYRVGTTDGKTGWVFGGFTAPFDENNRAAIYRRIAADRLKPKRARFGEMAGLARFLTVVVSQPMNPNVRGGLRLARLIALARAAEAIPERTDKQPPYRAWLRANQSALVYSDMALQWFVNPQLFWDLAKRYRRWPIGERILWEATGRRLPYECEGFLGCYIGSVIDSECKYLDVYPRGKYVEAAMKNIIEVLKYHLEMIQSPGAVEEEDKPGVLSIIATIRATIQKTASLQKARALELLIPYEQYVRR